MSFGFMVATPFSAFPIGADVEFSVGAVFGPQLGQMSCDGCI
jgi:hypothetical protein